MCLCWIVIFVFWILWVWRVGCYLIYRLVFSLGWWGWYCGSGWEYLLDRFWWILSWFLFCWCRECRLVVWCFWVFVWVGLVILFCGRWNRVILFRCLCWCWSMDFFGNVLCSCCLFELGWLILERVGRNCLGCVWECILLLWLICLKWFVCVRCRRLCVVMWLLGCWWWLKWLFVVLVELIIGWKEWVVWVEWLFWVFCRGMCVECFCCYSFVWWGVGLGWMLGCYWCVLFVNVDFFVVMW